MFSSFAEYFTQFDEALSSLFLEMPRYGKSSGRLVPFDENDVAFVKPFLTALDAAGERLNRPVTDKDKTDVVAWALRYRYSKMVLDLNRKVSDSDREEGNDPRNISFPWWERVERPGQKAFVKQIAQIWAKNVPINAKQLWDKIRNIGWNPSQVAFTNVMSTGRANALIEFMKDPSGYVKNNDGPPGYNPDPKVVDFLNKDGEKSDSAEAEDLPKKTRRFNNPDEMTVKSFDKINLDKDDETYLKDVEAAIVDHRKSYPDVLRMSMNTYLAQALAARYSNCFIIKKNGNFAPRPEYTSETGHIILKDGRRTLRLPTMGFNPSSLTIRINARKLAEKFEKVKKTIGYDFVDSPLIDCSTGAPKDLGKSTGMQTAKRWLSQGFYQPYQGTSGSEFVPDDQKLAKIASQQEKYIKGDGESPNVPSGSKPTPRVSWHDLLKQDVMAGWNMAMAIVRGRDISQKPGYMEFLGNERDDIIDTVMSQLEYGLSGKDEYVHEDWRRRRASTLIKGYIEKKIDDRWRSQSASSGATTKSGEEGASRSDLTPSKEATPLSRVMKKAARPELTPQSGNDEIAKWVDSYFSSDEQSIDRRYNPTKKATEVEIAPDQWYTRDELMTRMLTYYNHMRQGE